MSGRFRKLSEWLVSTVIGISAMACNSPAQIAKVPPDALIVDVRTPAEYQAGHIQGALNIPVNELEQRVAEFGDKTKPIVVYCRSGRRSAAAKAQLEKLGFVNVTNGGSMENVSQAIRNAQNKNNN